VLDPKAIALLIIGMQNTYMADKETNEEIARYLKRVTGNDYSTDRQFISSVLLVSVRFSVFFSRRAIPRFVGGGAA
jgi:hypothetical protein